jgi:hypothetical protein
VAGRGESGFKQLRACREPGRANATSATLTAAAENAPIDRAERLRVIDGAIANLKEHYVDPTVAQKMADAPLAHDRAGDCDATTDGTAFALLLTGQPRM